MRRRATLALAGAAMLAALACAKPRVWVPPRIDLHEYGTLGMIEFDASPGYGAMVTRQFLATLHSAQSGVPVVELGPLAPLLHAVGHEAMDREAVRAIAQKYGVDAVVVGELNVDQARPNFSIQSFTEANASAEIAGTLEARLLDARSGATLWSDRARGTRTVAHVNLAAGRRPGFGAVDPEGEHEKLVAWLVRHATDDFRGSWVRR